MVKININTKEGINSVTTNKLKGELKAIILSQESIKLSKVRVLIESEYNYILLDYLDLINPIYIPLCKRMINTNAHEVNEWVNYYLDEKLKITVFGGKNQEIQIILKII